MPPRESDMAIEVADGVFQLAPLPYVNVVAVRGGDGWTIIDAGVPQTGQRLVGQLGRLGIRRGDVERVVLTHGHGDHAGGAERVRAAFDAREVVVGEADLGAVRAGENASGEPGSALARSPLPLPGYAPPAHLVAADGPIALDDRRSLVPVATPGHTDGHVAWLVDDANVVAGGDTLFNVFRLTPSPGFLCSDADRNLASILKLAELAPSTLLLAHGTPVHDDVEGRLREVARA